MTKPELDATPEFDCLMVCLLLTLSWDERLLKKLFRKFGLQQENPRFTIRTARSPQTSCAVFPGNSAAKLPESGDCQTMTTPRHHLP